MAAMQNNILDVMHSVSEKPLQPSRLRLYLELYHSSSQLMAPVRVSFGEASCVGQASWDFGSGYVGETFKNRIHLSLSLVTRLDPGSIRTEFSIKCSPDVFMDADDTGGPSTSAHASLMNQLEGVKAEKEELRRRLAKYEGREVEPVADSVVPEMETLWEVEGKLSPLDKIVQLYFDEVFTNNQVLYSRANDAIIGCNYVDERKKNTRVASVLKDIEILLNRWLDLVKTLTFKIIHCKLTPNRFVTSGS
uniref:Uncharacterized protein n=1 Tax=Glossina palpalis gambiensis TaxID=67801 RepID=A0A1B0C5E5_9MUSC